MNGTVARDSERDGVPARARIGLHDGRAQGAFGLAICQLRTGAAYPVFGRPIWKIPCRIDSQWEYQAQVKVGLASIVFHRDHVAVWIGRLAQGLASSEQGRDPMCAWTDARKLVVAECAFAGGRRVNGAVVVQIQLDVDARQKRLVTPRAIPVHVVIHMPGQQNVIEDAEICVLELLPTGRYFVRFPLRNGKSAARFHRQNAAELSTFQRILSVAV